MLDLIASPTKLRLLRCLWTSGAAHTGRELARAVGMDPKNAALALRDLTEGGLVVRRPAGRAYLYSFNVRNYLAGEVGHLLEAERNWPQALAAEVRDAAGARAETVVLFGSRARGEAGMRSDIDLLIVIRSHSDPEAVKERLNSQRLRLEERYGHALSFLVMTRSGLRDKVREGDRLALDIVAQGQVLAGKPLSELMAYG